MEVDRGATPEAVRHVLASPCVVKALKEAAGGADANFASEACVKRYIRANEGDTQAAAVALAETINWRQTAKPLSSECPNCMQNLHSHNLRVVGVDPSTRPVIYTCFSQAMNRWDPEASIVHLMRALEDAATIQAKLVSEGRPFAEKCVWVVDFHGYNFIKDSNPRAALLAVRLLAHFPERLGRAVLVDAPRVFGATWTAVKKVLNETTTSKVNFTCLDDGSFDADLATWAGDELRSWLKTEVTENRHKALQNGEKEYWNPKRSRGFEDHDPRGTPSFVESSGFKMTFTHRCSAAKTEPKIKATPSSDIIVMRCKTEVCQPCCASGAPSAGPTKTTKAESAALPWQEAVAWVVLASAACYVILVKGLLQALDTSGSVSLDVDVVPLVVTVLFALLLFLAAGAGPSAGQARGAPVPSAARSERGGPAAAATAAGRAPLLPMPQKNLVAPGPAAKPLPVKANPVLREGCFACLGY